ncbi:GntR family transcriptional regulator [Paeniglutamicibacter sp. ZC-3]|uniref:GntR family transcriptional regulator n=1 Tax=Paeniglutamicibacter TaxID=1742990 RepID=UPI0021F72716|nr:MULTISPECIES: GntR family transcriptional regulator [Paeniglutamicibacter]MCV9995508.1 GntR family transcriptional regulator [Paeniglutamicibacter sp. ZC-3]MDO2935454.1 GntR family transcriptional regulator [Paeniglutamicibacter sulfureus]
MSTLITVDLRDATPPFEQIRAQIASLIAVGHLSDGTRLPTVRALAGDLGVATGTVARAYKELEARGLVESRRRLGTVVTSPAARPATVPVQRVHSLMDELIATARHSGIDDAALLSLFQGKLRSGE